MDSSLILPTLRLCTIGLRATRLDLRRLNFKHYTVHLRSIRISSQELGKCIRYRHHDDGVELSVGHNDARLSAAFGAVAFETNIMANYFIKNNLKIKQADVEEIVGCCAVGCTEDGVRLERVEGRKWKRPSEGGPAY